MNDGMFKLTDVVSHPSHGYGMVCQVRKGDPIPYTVRFKRDKRELPMTGANLTKVGNEHYFEWARKQK